ncbi:hypothetical protein DPMN_115779 [Dreissena polymorpha]|uniref:Uncharacterized protein n=1 Tax=Dreissena polymorpha TaxID=45954 RepID=A0A9D4QTN7_DREPO|nr:hypothetical protein DPMN_115779 [Dreissena polymorpha]
MVYGCCAFVWSGRVGVCRLLASVSQSCKAVSHPSSQSAGHAAPARAHPRRAGLNPPAQAYGPAPSPQPLELPETNATSSTLLLLGTPDQSKADQEVSRCGPPAMPCLWVTIGCL